MKKILVAIFDSESTAHQGLTALKDLHRNGDITLYATAVVAKDMQNKASLKQVSDDNLSNTAAGLLAGSIVGILGGPIGVLAGSSVGALTGSLFDLRDMGMSSDFIQEICDALIPGKTAVIADIDETWTTPVDVQLEKLDAIIFRQLESKVEDDVLERERKAQEDEIASLKQEIKSAAADHKAALEKELDRSKQKLAMIEERAKVRYEHLKKKADHKVAAVESQMQTAAEHQKSKLKSMADKIKQEYEIENNKFIAAQERVKKALFG